MMGTAPADIAFAIDGNAARAPRSRASSRTAPSSAPTSAFRARPCRSGHLVDDVVASGPPTRGRELPGTHRRHRRRAVTPVRRCSNSCWQRSVGDTVSVVTIDRDGAEQTLSITLGERQPAASYAAIHRYSSQFLWRGAAGWPPPRSRARIRSRWGNHRRREVTRWQ
jgi:hypothetical protein